MSRREYEERAYFSREAPARGATVRTRERDEEVDIYTRREVDRDGQPTFLREDYIRVEDQPLVLRERKVETFTRPAQVRLSSPERERVRTRIIKRERQRSPSPPQVERLRTRVIERERTPEPERVRTRIVERERERSPPGERVVRTRVVEREREREREPSVERIRTTTRTVERERSPSPVRERVWTTRTVERERKRSPSPIRERIRTREIERERTPPIIEKPVIRVPPIHQEVITHHRHIDHGYEYALAPTPPPRQRTEKETEIDIYRGSKGDTEIDIHTSKKRGGREEIRETRETREIRGGRAHYDDDILIERDRDTLKVRDTHSSRRRSMSTQRVMGSSETEAAYYARRTAERAHIGEAYNGATRDWSIVDVPPGTERVRMDGVGGASQEITWQKYNGVRRSRFVVPERDSLTVYDREYERDEISDRRLGPRGHYSEMWTEITKDLVVREAIEELGYDFEETEYFFYIIQYLRHEDVQELVLLSDEIRRERQGRIREITYERDHLREREERERRREPTYEDERIVEREIIYDAPGRRRGGHLH